MSGRDNERDEIPQEPDWSGVVAELSRIADAAERIADALTGPEDSRTPDLWTLLWAIAEHLNVPLDEEPQPAEDPVL